MLVFGNSSEEQAREFCESIGKRFKVMDEWDLESNQYLEIGCLTMNQGDVNFTDGGGARSPLKGRASVAGSARGVAGSPVDRPF